MLTNQHIALYISGSIAAYKSAVLTRLLVKAGAQVRIIMTTAATRFITPLTMQTLSKHFVYPQQITSDDAPVAHIDLADWTDIAIVAPATGNIIAKMANGIADDFATTTLLATTAPKYVVPTMNVHMWSNPATQRNLTILKKDGTHIIEPATGFLAEGYEGKGRMPEPSEIIKVIQNDFMPSLLTNKHVLISAGGTREPIDPVRYITNRSSGKMGYALATAAQQMGADVTLVSTANLPTPPQVKLVKVTNAQSMQKAMQANFKQSDVVIMAAAVADYRVANVASQKIKKNGNQELILHLISNPDILANLGAHKTHQYVVGFAAESQNLLANAQTKLQHKNVNMIIANNISDPKIGFNSDDNQVTILRPQQPPQTLPLANKLVIAREILTIISNEINY